METQAVMLENKIEKLTGISIKHLLVAIMAVLILCYFIGWKTFILFTLVGIGLYLYFGKTNKQEDAFSEQENRIRVAFKEISSFLKKRKNLLLFQVDLIRVEHQRKEREKSLLKKNLFESKKESEDLARHFMPPEHQQYATNVDKRLSSVNEQLNELDNETSLQNLSLVFNNNPLFACISNYGVFYSDSEVLENLGIENPPSYASEMSTQTVLTQIKPLIPFNTSTKPRDYTKIKVPIGFVGEFGASDFGQFESPAAMFIDESSDLLYIGDSGYEDSCNKIHVLSTQGKYIRCATLWEDKDEIRGINICDDAVFISHCHTLCKYTLKEFKLVTTSPDCKGTYGGITSKGKEIFVAKITGKDDPKNICVAVFDTLLNFKREIGTLFQLNGDCSFPDLKIIQGVLYSIIYGNDDNTYIFMHNSMNGKHIDSITVKQECPQNQHCSFCLDNNKNFIVTSYSDSTVEIYDSEKKRIKALNTSKFDCCGPTSVRIDSKNNIFVLFNSGVCPLIIL